MYLFQEEKIKTYQQKYSASELSFQLYLLNQEYLGQIWDQFHRPLIRSLTDQAEQLYTLDYVHSDMEVFQKKWLTCFLEELLMLET